MYYRHSVIATQSLCRQLNWIIQLVFTVLLFSRKFLQFVNVRLASMKLVNTGNFYFQSDSTIHSSSSNFTEYHVTFVVKEKKDVIFLSDFGTCPTTFPSFRIATVKGL